MSEISSLAQGSAEPPAFSAGLGVRDDLYPLFPKELKDLPRWVVWKIETRGGNPTKVPYNALTGERADTTNPSTWSDYSTAVAKSKGYAGIGCIISPPYSAVDIDKCRDPETGQIEPWAQAIIDEMNSYCELSPSGSGVHIWFRGELPKGRRRAGRVEMYGEARYFTVTGLHVAGTPLTVEARDPKSLQSRIETLDPINKQRLEAKQAEHRVVNAPTSRIDALMAGEWKGLYESQSEADAALCTILATKHNCNAARMDAEFRTSKLMREKWNEKRGSETYGQRTIHSAIELVEGRSPGVRNPDEPVDWRSAFKSYDQMEPGELQFLISGLIPYGVNFIAGLSSVGKTWLALSAAKAIVTGKKFLGNYDIPTPGPVIYLIPESGERAFRARLDRMQIKNAGESFLCRTMHSGPILGLQSPELLEAARVLNPVVFLDTVIRFSPADDENSATQNRALANGMFGLVTAGARGVIGLHHRAKASAKDKEMTLENTLRGTGDLGAVADSVYGLKCLNEETLEIRIQCVKARDFEPVKPFHIQGRPFINQIGNFTLLTEPGQGQQQTEIEKLVTAISAKPGAGYRELSTLTGIASGRIAEVAGKAGWKKGKQLWSQPEKSGLWASGDMN
jgi:hypothetical protein